MGRLVKVAEEGDIEEGKGRVFLVEGRTLAVFRVKDEYYAMNNNCLHRGGPLGEGGLEGHMVTCPWHGWSYDVRSGAFKVIPNLKVRTYPVWREGGSILVELD